ncbi:MAG: hypothetical protein V1733_11420 [bacterium]
MKNPFSLFIIICSMMLISCKRDNGVMCTQEYRMLTISIKDAASNPVILSQYFVKKTSTDEVIDFSQEDHYLDSINRLNGIYFVLTDSKIGMTLKNGTEFEFHGLLGTTEIVNEKYIIGNDECHVIMLSGKTQIILGAGL